MTSDSDRAERRAIPCLEGGGELGALVRAKNWFGTPVGDPAHWPQSLRVALGICLSSKYPMHVWWGRELTFFYNDAYIAFLGPGKHPAVLGRSGREAWAEIWNQIGPIVERVLATGEASSSEDTLMFFDRALPQEEVYVTFSFSPIRGEDGKVAGLFCASSEATEKIVGARRLETLRQLARATEARSVEEACRQLANAIANNPYDIPFARLYLVDDDGSRASLAAAVGQARPVWTMPDTIDLNRRDTVWPLRDVLAIRQTARAPLPVDPRSMEVWPYCTGEGIVLPVRVAGQQGLFAVLAVATSQRRPVDAAYLDFLALVQGHIGNALSHARAYEGERQRAEALAEVDRVNKSRLQLALDASKMGTFVWHVQEDRGEPDAQMLALFGQPPEGALSLKAAMETMIHPDDRDRYAAAITRASDPAQGGALREDIRVVMPDGSERWLAVTGQTTFDREGAPLVMAGAAVDITVRKSAEAVLRRREERHWLLLRLSDALRPLTDPVEIQETATRMLGEHLGASRVGYAEDRGDGETVVVTQHYAHDVSRIEGVYRYRDYGMDQVEALRAGRTFVRADVAADPALSDEEKEAHRRLQVGATVTMPLMAAERLSAVMFLHYAHPYNPTIEELYLVESVGGRAWAAVQRARAEQALRESEELFRQFAAASSDVLWIRDARTLRWEYLTPAFEGIYGMSVESALQGGEVDLWLQFVVEEDRDRVLSMLRQARRGERVSFEFRITRRADGEVRWMRNTVFPILDDAGNVVRIGGIGQDITQMRRVEERIRQNEQRLRSAVEVARLGTWDWNVMTGEVAWSDEHFRMAGYAVGEVQPSYDAWLARVHPDDRDEVQVAMREAMDGRGEYAREFRFLHPDGSVHWASARGRFFYDEAGAAVRMTGAMLETTERREWEETQKVLVSELQHRTRNIMAVVSSIADRTLASSRNIDEFTSRFRDRLGALARVQNLLSRLNEADRVSFDELLRSELAAHGALEHPELLRLEGPGGVALRSGTVQPLAMALHELATNAAKYGALTQPDGRLEVRWHLMQQDGGNPQLAVIWKETGVRMTQGACRGGGAGRELIEKALPYQIGAQVSYVQEADGVRCEMVVPVSSRMHQADIARGQEGS